MPAATQTMNGPVCNSSWLYRCRSGSWLRTGLLAALLIAFSSAPHKALAEESDSEKAESRQDILEKQRKKKQEELSPYRLNKWEKFILAYEKRPWHAKILDKGFAGFNLLMGGMRSGSGFVLGAGYMAGRESDWVTFRAEWRYSSRNFRRGLLRLDFPTKFTGSKLTGYLQGRFRDAPGVRFFGLGTNTSDGSKSFYAYEDQMYSAGVEYRPTKRIELSGEVGMLDPEVGSGNRSPSLENTFMPVTVPGFESQSRLFFYGAKVGLNLRDDDVPRVGAQLFLGFQRFEDQDLERYSFTRFNGELRFNIPLPLRNRRLAVRFMTSNASPDDGNEVPFYLMESLGGAATIRGFDEYRFHDRRNLLLNVEYRWEVWSFLDFTAFVDMGKVFRDSDGFDFSELKTGYGVGMRVFTPSEMQVRIDIARSPEGYKLHIGSGVRF